MRTAKLKRENFVEEAMGEKLVTTIDGIGETYGRRLAEKVGPL